MQILYFSSGVGNRCVVHGNNVMEGAISSDNRNANRNVENGQNLNVDSGNVEGQCRTNNNGVKKNGNASKPMSFSSVVQGSNFGGSNELKLIPCSKNNEGKLVVEMDPIIEEGSKKWNLTVVGYFVGFKMSYREIVGHLKRMWGEYQLEEIIVNESGLYFFKFKSDNGLQGVIENGPWLVDQKPLFVQK